MNERADEVDTVIEGDHSFDAFISYSRDDIDFARALEKTLQNFRPPKGIGHERRRLRVFRDESDLVGTHYPEAISRFLKRSQKLIVICTPSARDSDFVDDEIVKFANAQGVRNIVPVLYRGRPNNEFRAGENDDRAFPATLEKLLEEPLATDYRAYDATQAKPNQGQFRNAWYTLLANLLDVGREDIEQRDFRRQRRDRMLVASIVAIVIASLATFGTIARIQKLRADEQRDLALSSLAVNVAAKSAALTMRQPDMGALLAVEAVTMTDAAGRTPVPEARQALRGALAANVGERLPDVHETSMAAGFSADGGYIFSAGPREIRTWQLPPDLGALASSVAWSSELAADVPVKAATSNNGQWMAIVAAQQTTALNIRAPGNAKTALAEIAAEIRSVRISNDGRWVLAGTKNNALYQLDMHAGDRWKVLIEPPDQENRYRALRRFGFGPGTNTVFAADYEGALRFWSSGNELADPGLALGTRLLEEVYVGRSRSVAGRVAVSQESRLLALAPKDKSMAVYALGDDASFEVALQGGDATTARSVRFGPGERTLIANLDSGYLAIWYIDNLGSEPILIDAELTSGAVEYRMSPNGQFLAAASDDSVRIWNMERPDRRPHEIDIAPDSLQFTPDSRRIVLVDGGAVYIRDVDDDDESSELLLQYPNRIHRLVISADSRWLLGVEKNTVRLTEIDNPFGGTRSIPGAPWEPELDTDISRTGPGFDSRTVMSGTPNSGLPNAGAFSADGRWFAAIGAYDNVLVADLSRPFDAPQRLEDIEEATAVAFDPSSRWLLTGSIDDNVQVWNLADLANPVLSLERAKTDGKSSVARLVFSPEGRWLAAGAGLGEVSIWDWRGAIDAQAGNSEAAARTATRAIPLGGHEGWVLSLDFAADGSLLVSAGERATQVWTPGSFEEPIARYEVPLGYSQARLVPGQRSVVAGGADGIVRIWDVDAPDSPSVELRGHEASIINITVHPREPLLATASDDGHILLWHLDQPDNGPFRELESPRTNRIEFVSSGLLITSGYDYTKLWNLSDLSETPIVLPGSGQAMTYWMEVSDHEDAIGIIAQDGVARIWPLGSARLIDIACRLANSNLDYSVWRDTYGDKPYERTCRELPAHASLVVAGKALAEAGDVNKAIDLMTRAVELDPERDIDPQQLVTRIAVDAMLDRGKALAKDGKVQAASVQFERAKALNGDAVADPSVYANQLAAAQLHLNHGKKMGEEGRYEVAVASFITARGLDPDIEVDPEAEAARLVAPVYRNRGRKAARALKIDRAIEQYRIAASYDPGNAVNPVFEAYRHAAITYRQRAERAAKRGDIESALESYEEALALDPTLDIDPGVATSRLAAPLMARRAVDEVRHGRVDEGIAQFNNAINANPDMRISAECWNQLCWSALLWNRPDAVSEACGRAVVMEPGNAAFLDTRGVYRVLTGQLSESVADFEAYIAAFENQRERQDAVAQRREWIAALQTGRNPLTEKELESLRPADNVFFLFQCAW